MPRGRKSDSGSSGKGKGKAPLPDPPAEVQQQKPSSKSKGKARETYENDNQSTGSNKIKSKELEAYPVPDQDLGQPGYVAANNQGFAPADKQGHVAWIPTPEDSWEPEWDTLNSQYPVEQGQFKGSTADVDRIPSPEDPDKEERRQYLANTRNPGTIAWLRKHTAEPHGRHYVNPDAPGTRAHPDGIPSRYIPPLETMLDEEGEELEAADGQQGYTQYPLYPVDYDNPDTSMMPPPPLPAYISRAGSVSPPAYVPPPAPAPPPADPAAYPRWQYSSVPQLGCPPGPQQAYLSTSPDKDVSSPESYFPQNQAPALRQTIDPGYQAASTPLRSDPMSMSLLVNPIPSPAGPPEPPQTWPPSSPQPKQARQKSAKDSQKKASGSSSGHNTKHKKR